MTNEQETIILLFDLLKRSEHLDEIVALDLKASIEDLIAVDLHSNDSISEESEATIKALIASHNYYTPPQNHLVYEILLEEYEKQS